MDAEEALRQGNPDAALTALQGQIRKHPADAKLRVFLFQLLAVLGDWNKALVQLNVAAELDSGTLAMAATYRDAVQAEALREQVFAGERDPIVFGEPQRWIALLFEALRAAGRGDAEQARGLREEAFDTAPASAGRIDGKAFSWIADADMRLGPVLEGILNGRYTWIPFQHIRSIRFDEPTDLRDLVWAPAQTTWTNGGEAIVLVPARYPGSADSDDASLRLARRTEWLERGSEFYIGLGQRMLATDRDEYPLLGIREIVLEQTQQGEDALDNG
jgi:type VI secretion system protein ImpE